MHVLLAALLAAVLLALPSSAGAAPRPLETGVFDPASFESAESMLAYDRVRDAGGTTARIWFGWSGIAPAGDTKPAGFDPRDPADPDYGWSYVDRLVVNAVAAGLEPIVMIVSAPRWAERHVIPNFKRGTGSPRPSDLRDFAHAIATRYNGEYEGLPRVRRWQIWNEPNGSGYLNPQYDTALSEPVQADSQVLSPDVYRPMVNAFASAVHSVHRDNIVIAGGLAPFGKYERWTHTVAPMEFMRRLLCMSRNNRPLPGCKDGVRFDAWSHHPYTQGDPTHKASFEDNVSLGDLPRMARLLRAATRAGHIVSRERPQFWVTEFGWDTRPPDPGGLPLKLHARWVSEALYRMWSAGVTLATTFQLRDDSRPDLSKSREITSGLYFRCDEGLACDRPKPALRAFTFPFVAFRGDKGIRVWGRTPASDPATVTLQRQRRSRWADVATLTADENGIFQRRLRRLPASALRARVGGASSQPFSLKRPPDRAVFPFGGDPCERSEREPGVCD